MGPFTICSGENCSFVWTPQNGGDLPPFFCPLCHKLTLYRCPSCNFPILVLRSDPVDICLSGSMRLKPPGPNKTQPWPNHQWSKVLSLSPDKCRARAVVTL